MTMQITIPRETRSGETRVALIPEDVQRLTKLGSASKLNKGLGIKPDLRMKTISKQGKL